MNMEQYTKEFNWILKVIQSCRTKSHILVATNCYSQFAKKWSLIYGKNPNFVKLSKYYNQCFKNIVGKKIKELYIY